MRIPNLVWAFPLVVIFLSGCVTGKEARELAMVNMGQIATYEKLVNEKIAAEKSFYKKRTAHLQKSLELGQTQRERNYMTRAVLDFQSSLGNAKEDLKAKGLRDFVSALLENLRKSRELNAVALTKYNEDLLNSLEKLELQSQSLQKVQTGLESLQTKSSDLALLKEMIDLGIKTKEVYEKAGQSGASK